MAGPAISGVRAISAQSFIENRGQWDAQAQFLARAPGVDLWITDRGVVYDFHETRVQGDPSQHPTPKAQHPAPRRGHVVRMEFVGGAPSPVRGESPIEGLYNYFGATSATGVRRYAEARSERVYDGVEARWYFHEGKPRYDLIVAPGADPAKIAMRFEGADGVVAEGSTLKLRTSLGEVRQTRLFAYQRVGAGVRPVPCTFRAEGITARFDVGEYDRTKPLVIDPLLWSTVVGGSGIDRATAVAIGADRSPVVAGYTYSTNFPSTVGAYSIAHGGSIDAFVAKLAADGTNLVYASFLGGGVTDAAYAVALDSAGDPVVAGYTASANFPKTPSPSHDDTYKGNGDAFVAKLSANGSVLAYSHTLGGADTEYAQSVAVDSLGSAVVAGYTQSADFKTTSGAFDQTYGGGDADAFVAKFAPDGSSLSYSSYLGGSKGDIANGVAVDALGNAFVTGYTDSSNFPSTSKAYDKSHAGGNAEVFLIKLAPNGASLEFGTFLGGAQEDVGQSVALDALGNPVVVGYASSTDFPTTAGAYDRTYNGGARDGFVAKFSANGNSLLFSSYFGGASFDHIKGVALDSAGNPLVAGVSFSTDLPTSATAHDKTHNGGQDAFFAKFSADGAAVTYGSYLGSAGTDDALGIAVDASGYPVLVGETTSSGFPTTSGAFDRTFNGGSKDAFVSRFQTSGLVSFTTRSSVVGGFALSATVQISDAAPPKGAIVTLATDNPDKITGPPRVTVSGGTTTKNFNIKTYTVLVDTVCQITASFGGVSKTLEVTLRPGGLQALKIKPVALVGGGSAEGTVVLSAPAPAGGRNVVLASESAAVGVPSAVIVAEGQTTATFPITTSVVGVTTTVRVSATLGVVTKKVSMTLEPSAG